jgi:hypothetical protein
VCHHNETGKVVCIMRRACVFTDIPIPDRAQIMHLLRGQWRPATRLIMVLLSVAGFSPAEIADLLDYHSATVRRRLHRYTTDGIPGLLDRPRLGGATLIPRITSTAGCTGAVDDPPDLATPGPTRDQPALPVATHPHRGPLATPPTGRCTA